MSISRKEKIEVIAAAGWEAYIMWVRAMKGGLIPHWAELCRSKIESEKTQAWVWRDNARRWLDCWENCTDTFLCAKESAARHETARAAGDTLWREYPAGIFSANNVMSNLASIMIEAEIAQAPAESGA